MANRRLQLLVVAGGSVGLLGGCVDRRFVVETNPPGAQISVDGKSIGPSPADGTFIYPGRYEIRAVAPGYEPLTKSVKLRPKWYDYPGLDFVAEVLYPGRIEDVRRVPLTLEPEKSINTGQLLDAATKLRTQGQNLPPQSVPPDETGPGVPEQSAPTIPGRVIPPIVPPPFPTQTESGIPAVGGLITGPDVGTPTPFGGSFNNR